MWFIKRLLLLCTFLAVLSQSAAAVDQIHQFDDIVVTATRAQEHLRDTGIDMTVITREEIEKKGASTVDEIFSAVPGLFVQNPLGNPKFSTIDIRGYGESAPSNVLFLIDGRRVNNVDISGADLAQIPVEAIERIEIYKGPATVMFGDNAMAGAVNIILKKGREKLLLKGSSTAGSSSLLSSAVSASGQSGPFSYFLLGSAYGTDGYRQNNTLRMKDLFGSFTATVNDRLSLALKTAHHEDHYGMPGPLLWQDLSAGLVSRTASKEPFNNGRTEDSFVDVEGEYRFIDGIRATMGGSARQRNTSSWFQGNYSGVNWSTQTEGKSYTYGLTPKILIEKPLLGLPNTFVTGFDYYRYPTQFTTESRFFGSLSTSFADITKTNQGFYANNKVSLVPNLLFDAGYRIEEVSYDTKYRSTGGFSTSSFLTSNERAEAFRSSLTYLFGSTSSIYLTYSSGFRFPTPDELVNVQTGMLNPALRPQKGWEIDLGFRWVVSSYLTSTVNGYYGKNKDEIYYNPLTFTNSNYDRTVRRGIEISVDLYPLDNLTCRAGYSWTEALFDSGPFNGNDLPLVPRNKLSFSSTYKAGDFSFNLLGVYTGRRYTISDQDNSNRSLSGYTTVDFNVLYRKGNFMAQGGVKNIGATQYYDYGVASAFGPRVNVYPAPERQYFLKVEYLFTAK